MFHLMSDMIVKRDTFDAVELHELYEPMEEFYHHISYQTLVDVDNLYNDFLAVYEADENLPTVIRN